VVGIVNQRELRNEATTVLREVRAGRTVVATRNGEPIAELRPIQPGRFGPRGVMAEAAASRSREAPQAEVARDA
jgi:prevent-host-death family protein